MAVTGVLHGAIVYLMRDGERVALARDPRIQGESPLAPVEPCGQAHPEEYLRVSSEVRFDFSIYRKDNASLVRQGLFPSMADMQAFVEHPETQIQINSTKDDTILHRITGFKVESWDVSYTKGEPAAYQVSGRAIFHFDESDN